MKWVITVEVALSLSFFLYRYIDCRVLSKGRLRTAPESETAT